MVIPCQMVEWLIPHFLSCILVAFFISDYIILREALFLKANTPDFHKAKSQSRKSSHLCAE